MNNTNSTKRVSATDISLIIIAIIWGTGFIATKMAIDYGMSPSIIMSARFIIATAIIYLVFLKKLKKFTKIELKYSIVTGLLLFSAFLCQTIGLMYTTPSNNAFLTSTTVIMVPFISWVINRKKPADKAFFAASIAMLGIAVLTNVFQISASLNIGDILTLCGAFLYACHISFLERAAKKVETEKLTFMQFATTAVLSLLYFGIFDINSVSKIESVAGFIPIVYLGIFSTCIAFFVQTRAQKTTHPSKTAIIISSEAVFASILSVVLGYEFFSISLLLGGILVMSAVVFTESKLKYRKIVF